LTLDLTVFSSLCVIYSILNFEHYGACKKILQTFALYIFVTSFCTSAGRGSSKKNWRCKGNGASKGHGRVGVLERTTKTEGRRSEWTVISSIILV